jgi:hypothetical protein
VLAARTRAIARDRLGRGGGREREKTRQQDRGKRDQR